MSYINKNKIIWLTLFCIAMALLESAVVVYLRALYYPIEFTVALKITEAKILNIELLRELATIIMLLSIAVLIGKTRLQQFAYFLIAFAVWDIFYYIWLKVFLDWPESLFTWDILFLIPVTWLAPVLAPVLCSLSMILLAIVILKQNVKSIKAIEWTLLTVGASIVLFTFVSDYLRIMFDHNLWADYSHLLENPVFIREASNYIPVSYLWDVFSFGLALVSTAIALIWKRYASFQSDRNVNLNMVK